VPYYDTYIVIFLQTVTNVQTDVLLGRILLYTEICLLAFCCIVFAVLHCVTCLLQTSTGC